MIKNKENNKRIILALLILILVGASILFYIQSRSTDSSGINYDPPTAQEKKSGDEIKPRLVEQEKTRNQTPVTTPSGKRSVTPVITYAGHYRDNVEVGAYVSGVFEEGGKCTLTLSKDGIQRQAEVTAIRGANSVDCPVMIVPVSSLSVGKWQAVVSYTSGAAEGSSASREVEVK